MSYIVRKVMKTLWWNRWISILMIAEITLGMSVFVYSANLYYSLSKEESARRKQNRDLVLEISSDEDSFDEQAFTKTDYEQLQILTGGKTFLYIALPQTVFKKEEYLEFMLVLLDYEQAGLDKGYSYWGQGTWELTEIKENFLPELQTKRMPKKLNAQSWKTETDEIALKDCVIAPMEYMDRMQEEIFPGAIHVEWKSSEISDVEGVSKEIVKYLNHVHGNVFHYRVYSPETELKNHAYKVKISISMLNKAGVLSLLTFSFGMLMIFGLLFEHRKEEFGIDLACGADYKQVFREIFFEIMALNGCGTMLGFFIGWMITHYIDLGIMIGGIKVQGDIRTYIFGVMACGAITGVVSVAAVRKLKDREIIGLLNGY